MKQFIYTKPPANFDFTIQASGCYCVHEGKLLLMKRHPSKPAGETWGVPAGKLESGESPKEGAVRELLEETAILVNQSDLSEIGILYVRLPHLDYVYHMYKIEFAARPDARINFEHTDLTWVTPGEAESLPLIAGGLEALNYYKLHCEQKSLRPVTRVGVYGVIQKGSKVLLISVKKSGCYGGLFDLPGGRIEYGETIDEALKREIREEVGLSCGSYSLMMNATSNLAILHTKDHIQFHQIGMIYKVHDWEQIPHAQPEEEYAWYEIDSLDLSRATPFAREALKVLKTSLDKV